MEFSKQQFIAIIKPTAIISAENLKYVGIQCSTLFYLFDCNRKEKAEGLRDSNSWGQRTEEIKLACLKSRWEKSVITSITFASLREMKENESLQIQMFLTAVRNQRIKNAKRGKRYTFACPKHSCCPFSKSSFWQDRFLWRHSSEHFSLKEGTDQGLCNHLLTLNSGWGK